MKWPGTQAAKAAIYNCEARPLLATLNCILAALCLSLSHTGLPPFLWLTPGEHQQHTPVCEELPHSIQSQVWHAHHTRATDFSQCRWQLEQLEGDRQPAVNQAAEWQQCRVGMTASQQTCGVLCFYCCGVKLRVVSWLPEHCQV
jgi:hypothetical protein